MSCGPSFSPLRLPVTQQTVCTPTVLRELLEIGLLAAGEAERYIELTARSITAPTRRRAINVGLDYD